MCVSSMHTLSRKCQTRTRTLSLRLAMPLADFIGNHRELRAKPSVCVDLDAHTRTRCEFVTEERFFVHVLFDDRTGVS